MNPITVSLPTKITMENNPSPWPTVRLAGLCAATGLSTDWGNELKRKLPEKIYWFRIPGSVRVLYNLRLIQDWLVNGDSPDHQRAKERFVAYLPSSEVA